MVQYSTGGFEAVSDVLVSEGANEHFFYSGEKIFSESLVGMIVLIEECRGGVESIEKFGDSGTSGVGWDDVNRAGVYGDNEGDGRQGVVNGA